MIYKSHQVNLDKEPWACPYEGRHAGVALCNECYLRPRPEFEPTRDPEPWLETSGPNTGARYGHSMWVSLKWAPRREQFDTPVNRVLTHFRQMHGFTSGELLRQAAIAWSASSMQMALAGACTPDEAKHARRVLTRLANWKE